MKKGRRKKKVIVISLTSAAVIFLAVGSYVYMQKQQEQKILDAMQLRFRDPLTVEYGSKTESDSLIEKISGGTLAEAPSLHTDTVGEQKLVFLLEKEGLRKEFPCTVSVKDSIPADIQFKQEHIVITAGDHFAAVDNIKSVSDKVDGDLSYRKDEKEPEKGTYVLSSDLDTDKPGTYSVLVQAMDKNGNLSKKEFSIEVKKAKEPVQKNTTDKAQQKKQNASQKKQSNADDSISPTYINGILLVNKTHPIPSSFGGGVDATAYAALQKLQNGAAEAGYSMPLISGYRSYDYQAQLYNSYAARDGQAAADRYSARPGKSEHQTGLAFDVGSIDNSYGTTPAGKWLAQNCASYGFILRYPQGKEHITGYMYEPWHIRYVGKDTAQAIMSSSLTLEEYLGAV